LRDWIIASTVEARNLKQRQKMPHLLSAFYEHRTGPFDTTLTFIHHGDGALIIDKPLLSNPVDDPFIACFTDCNKQQNDSEV
jgi:hypothetical protein